MPTAAAMDIALVCVYCLCIYARVCGYRRGQYAPVDIGLARGMSTMDRLLAINDHLSSVKCIIEAENGR